MIGKKFFIFSLLLFGIVLPGCKSEKKAIDESAETHVRRFMSIGAISPTWENVRKIRKFLDDSKIPNYTEGSVVYGVFVEIEYADRARTILRRREDFKEFLTVFDEPRPIHELMEGTRDADESKKPKSP